MSIQDDLRIGVGSIEKETKTFKSIQQDDEQGRRGCAWSLDKRISEHQMSERMQTNIIFRNVNGL